jgi:hypothetical protein
MVRGTRWSSALLVGALAALGSFVHSQDASGFKAGEQVEFKPNQFQDVWESGVIVKVLPESTPGLRQVVVRHSSPYNPTYLPEEAYDVRFVRHPAPRGTSGAPGGQPAASGQPVGTTAAAVSGIGATASAGSAPAGAFKVGDRVEGWNVAWYKGAITRVGTGDRAGYYLVHHDDFATDQYYAEKNLRRLGGTTGAPAAGTPQAGPPAGLYLCGVFLGTSGAFTSTQKLTLEGDGAYRSSTGAGGRWSWDGSQVQFADGGLSDVVGRYEPANHGIIRLTQRTDLGASRTTQQWKSQVCSPQH